MLTIFFECKQANKQNQNSGLEQGKSFWKKGKGTLEQQFWWFSSL